MEYGRFGDRWVLRVDKGEEVVAALRQFCEREGVRLASVSGIGATDRIVLGYFEAGAKKYHTFERTGDHEITALNGTVSTLGGEIYLHLHVTLSDRECRAFGGHLNSAVVSGTCELVIDPLEGELERRFDEEVGLNLVRPVSR